MAVNKISLRENMNRYFSLDEIESLCFDLGVDFENIGGSSKPGKVLELIQYMERRGRLDELAGACAKSRPNVDWGAAGVVVPPSDRGDIGKRQARLEDEAEPIENLGPIENRLALVVGINNYTESNSYPTLSYCVKDANDMAQALKACNYSVRLLRDVSPDTSAQFPTRINIRAELKELCAKTRPNDLLLLYFACHGVVLDDGRQFVIVQDTRSKELEDSSLALVSIKDLIKQLAPARRCVLILDACHSGADVREITEKDVVLHAYESAHGFATIAASTSKQVANEVGGNGLFTKFVLEALSGTARAAFASQEKVVTVSSLQNYALAGVRKWTIENGRKLQEPSSVDAVVGDMILADFRNNP